jgi:hypothetical protein
MKLIKPTIAVVAMVILVTIGPACAASKNIPLIAYFLEQTPDGFDALFNVPVGAKDVVLATVSLQQHVVWLGGRH